MAPPPPPKISAKQVELDKARKAAKRATEAAVVEFKRQTRLYKNRLDVKQIIFDHIPVYKFSELTIDTRSVFIAVSYSPRSKTCVTTIWFELPSGTPPNVDRDRSRILLAHIAALAISTIFFKQADRILPDSKSQDDVEKLSESITKLQKNIDDKQTQLDVALAEAATLQAEIDALLGTDMRESKKNEAAREAKVALMKTKTSKVDILKSTIGTLQRQLTDRRSKQELEQTIVYDKSFFDEARKKPSLLLELVSQTTVDPARVTIVNFPGPLKAVASDPASTQVQVRLDGADSPLASGVLSAALGDESVDNSQISNYVVASFAQMLYGYGIGYVGNVKLASKDLATVRTKLCVALDPQLNGPSYMLMRDDGTPWTVGDYETHVYNSVTTEELDKSDSRILRILRRIAIAIIADSIDERLIDQDSLWYLYNLRSDQHVELRLVGNRRQFAIAANVTSVDFLSWATSELRDDPRFNEIMASVGHPVTGVASTVFKKLLNARKRLSFNNEDEIMFLRFALGVDENAITQGQIDAMVRNNENPRYYALQQYSAELERVEREKGVVRAADRADRAKAKAIEDSINAEMRVPIVQLAVFGAAWAVQRDASLNGKQLEFLFGQKSMPRKEKPRVDQTQPPEPDEDGDLSLLPLPLPLPPLPPPPLPLPLPPLPPDENDQPPKPNGGDHISRELISSNRGSASYQFKITDDTMEKFVSWIRTIKIIHEERIAMERELKKQACVAIVENHAILDLPVEDYLRYVEDIQLPATDNGMLSEDATKQLAATAFAQKCQTAAKRRRKRAPMRGPDEIDPRGEDEDEIGPLDGIDEDEIGPLDGIEVPYIPGL